MALYTPRQFQARSDEEALRIIREHPFATLVTSVDGADAHISHVPMLLEDGWLWSHLARPNPHSQALERGRTQAVFQGPHQYISPRWYAQPELHVPTWNYAVVHVSGQPELLDAAGARRVVERLTAHYEQGAWTPQPQRVESLLGGILAFRMPLTRISAKVKMNQNRTAADRDGVRAALQTSGVPGDAAVADWIREP